MELDTVTNPYPSTPPLPPSYVPITPQRSLDQDVCYNCRERGHWSSDCPNKTSKISGSSKFSSPGSSTDNSSNMPVVRCPCGTGVCPVFTSRTGKNPQRRFYICPADQSKGKCGFFKWCDEIRGVPICACGAGTCSLNRTSTGPDEGKWYFACRIKKNHGACDFFQWTNNEINSAMNRQKCEKNGFSFHQPNFNTGNNDMGNEEVDSDHPVNVLQSDIGKVPDKELIMQNIDTSNPITGNELQAFQSKPATATESHSLTELRNNTFDAGITINKEYEDMSDVEDSSSTRIPGQDVRDYGGSCPEALPLKTPCDRNQANDALAKCVKKFAQSLLDILVNMSPHDPEQMLNVAEAIFSSLQKMSNDSGPFVQAVKDYIRHVSRLTSVEESMHSRLSSEKLSRICENEKAKLKNSSRVYSEALAAYKASMIQRQLLHEQIVHMKGALIQLEEQLLCCEMETSTHKSRSDEASKEMLELEKSLESVTVDLAEAVELERQRELASNALRAAFEAAKAWMNN